MKKIIIKNITLLDDEQSLKFYRVKREFAYIDEALAKTLEGFGAKTWKTRREHEVTYIIHLYKMPETIKQREGYEKTKQNPDLILSVMETHDGFGSDDIFVHVYEGSTNGCKYVKLFYDMLNTD